MKIITIVLLFIFQDVAAVIYRLNDTELALMPALVRLDSYEACKQDEDTLYCTAEFVLVSDEPSPLLNMIKEYSEHQVTHYNHTKLRYGICVTQNCNKYYQNESMDISSTLEACLNDSLSNEYNLRVRVLEGFYCRSPGKPTKDIDLLDVFVGIICIVFVAIIIAVSLYENVFGEIEKNKATRFLLCFSWQRNWKTLMTTTDEGRDPRVHRLRSLHGIRVISMALVIFYHSFLKAWLLVDDTKPVEDVYLVKMYYLLMNGSLTMQTFLMMSAFLLVYLWLLESERQHITWSMVPSRIVRRWLKLTPAYAFTIALTATWFAHLTSGPFWNKYVETEMRDCRQYWWQHLLYINNFFNNSECCAQSWYLAVDYQLYCLAVLILLSCRTARSRIITLSVLFIASAIIPGVIVYLQDLDATMMVSPEAILRLLIHEPYFQNVYNRSYCNLSGYVVGIALGYLIYYWQQQGVDFKKIKTFPHRMIYWSLVPLFLYCCYIGNIFYLDAPRQSVYVRAAYAAFSKPLFSLCIGGLFVGMYFEFEGFYRGILEWRGWIIPSKLSYCAFLLHLTLVRNQVATLTKTEKMEVLPTFVANTVMAIVSFGAALVYWMLIAAPLDNFVQKCISKPKFRKEYNVIKQKPTKNQNEKTKSL